MKEKPMDRLIADLAPSVADLGARGGLDEDMLPIAWAGHAIGFEPDPDEATRLATVGDPRWRKTTILPYAVGGESGSAVLHVPESNEGASLLPHNAAMIDAYGYENLHATKKRFPVDVHTLDELRQRGELPRIDYLKIDIEGAELQVLKAAAETLCDCVAIKVECSFLEQRIGQPLIWEVASYLLGCGFCAMDIRDIRRWRRRNLPAHPYRVDFQMPYSRGQLAQCDLIFLKAPKAVSDIDQTLRLVVLSAVLGYYDYAITVLRTNPDVATAIERKYGIALERELEAWSRDAGRREARAAIKSSIRGLIPLMRSALNCLPYPAPRNAY